MFENNLSKLNNTRLKEDLRNIPISDCTSDIAFVQTLNGHIVFLKGEIPTDDTVDPIKYAQSLISNDMKVFKTNDIIISVGIGVGYILDELYNNTKCKIVIYEPDSRFLRFVFETVDLTKYLSDNRVFISDKDDECVNFILKNYLNDDKIEFAVSPILSIFYKDDIEMFSSKMYSKLKSKIIDINTIKNLSKKWVNNILKFVSKNKEYYSVEDLKSKFSGKNALILGAGPSLADNIEKIKQNRDKFTIFAVNKVLNTLQENDIVPDFALFTDSSKVVYQLNLTDEYISQLNIIRDWKSEDKIADLKCKNLLLYFSDNEFFLQKYAKDLGIQLFPSESTTTIMSLICALHMDFNKIYFCGFDLAFKEDTAYCDGATIDIVNGKAVISEHKRNVLEVMSVTGKMIPTREDYSLFIKTMETIIKSRGLKNLYNITDFGAYIEGMNYTSFDAINIYGTKEDTNSIINSIPICNKDLKQYISMEKSVMISIHENIINNAPINEIALRISNETTLLYEYLQMELIEMSRNPFSMECQDEFRSKSILAIDRLLALIR